MAQNWFGKLRLLASAWPRSLNRYFRLSRNRNADAIAKPPRFSAAKHVFFGHQNRVMFGVLFLLVLSTCYELFWPLAELPRAKNSPAQVLGTNTPATRPLPALDDYLNMARKRELFKPSVPLPAEKKLGQTTAEELAKRFKFLGVSGSGSDSLALVAVANAGVQTVKQGERLEDFLIKEISPGQLVLELNEDTVVLKR